MTTPTYPPPKTLRDLGVRFKLLACLWAGYVCVALVPERDGDLALEVIDELKRLRQRYRPGSAYIQARGRANAKSVTLTASHLTDLLLRAQLAHGATIPVRLIVGGVAYAANQAWVEPHQEGRNHPAVCIGDDPR